MRYPHRLQALDETLVSRSGDEQLLRVKRPAEPLWTRYTLLYVLGLVLRSTTGGSSSIGDRQ